MSITLQIKNGDIVNSAINGRANTVTGGVKLRQDIIEFFTIQVLPNGFGAGLDQLIGLTEIGQEVYITMADRQIRDGLAAFIELQRSDSRISRSPSERVLNVTGLLIEQDVTDPTKYWFRVNFVTEAGKAESLAVSN